MAIILPDDALAAELPKTRVVIAACSDQVGAVSTECAIPHPSLMAMKRGLQRERSRIALRGRREVVAGLQVVWS
jgi:hypothetical protein